MAVSTRDAVTPDLIRKQRELAALPQGAYQQFRDATPRRSGNARRRTVLRQDTIEAQYPYARELDQGSSGQAPQGMTQPTIKWLQQQLNRIFR